MRFQIEELKRKGEFNQVAELQYGKLPELEKELKSAQVNEANKPPNAASRLLRTQVGTGKLPRWLRA